MAGSFRVTLRKSPISYTAKARGSLRALGLHRIGQTVEVVDNPQTRGMARAVRFLVEVDEGGATKTADTGAPAGTGAPAASTAATNEPQPAKPRGAKRSPADEAS